MNHAFFLLKPDAVERGLIGTLLNRIIAALHHHEAVAKLARLELGRVNHDFARWHYGEHAESPFFPDLVDFLASGPLVSGLVASTDPSVVATLRHNVGHYSGREIGTIRHEYRERGAPAYKNLIHAADSPEAVAREAALWFGRDWATPL